MMNNKWTSLVTALALCVGMSGVALAQNWGQQSDRYNNVYSEPHRYYWRGDSNIRAERFGYQDGVIDGRNDAATGHSFRPTYDRSYRNATNGYSGYGSLGAYRQEYREAYMQGYRAGFSQNRGWRWNR